MDLGKCDLVTTSPLVGTISFHSSHTLVVGANILDRKYNGICVWQQRTCHYQHCLLLDFVVPTYLASYCKSRRPSSLHTTTEYSEENRSRLSRQKLFLVLQKADYNVLGVPWRVVIAHKRSINCLDAGRICPRILSFLAACSLAWLLSERPQDLCLAMMIGMALF